MNYLDYVQMTKGQQIAYNIKSFFTGIPGAIAGLFRAIGMFFVGVFKFIGNGFKGYGSRFVKGDFGTKLSYVVCGAGNIFHGQIMKGLIMLACEVGYFYFMAVFGLNQLRLMYSDIPIFNEVGEQVGIRHGSVGDTPTHVVATEGLFGATYTTMPGNDSAVILLYGVLTLVVTVVFFAFYIANTKSAYETYLIKAEGGKPNSFFKDIYDLFDSENTVHHIKRLLILCLIDLIDMFQKLEAFSQTQIPVELRSLTKYNADFPDNLFPVFCDILTIDQYASLCGRQDP